MSPESSFPVTGSQNHARPRARTTLPDPDQTVLCDLPPIAAQHVAVGSLIRSPADATKSFVIDKVAAYRGRTVLACIRADATDTDPRRPGHTVIDCPSLTPVEVLDPCALTDMAPWVRTSCAIDLCRPVLNRTIGPGCSPVL